jgi:hypothetical protein
MIHTLPTKRYNNAYLKFKRHLNGIKIINIETNQKLVVTPREHLHIKTKYPIDENNMYNLIFDTFKINYSLVENIELIFDGNI